MRVRGCRSPSIVPTGAWKVVGIISFKTNHQQHKIDSADLPFLFAAIHRQRAGTLVNQSPSTAFPQPRPSTSRLLLVFASCKPCNPGWTAYARRALHQQRPSPRLRPSTNTTMCGVMPSYLAPPLQQDPPRQKRQDGRRPQKSRNSAVMHGSCAPKTSPHCQHERGGELYLRSSPPRQLRTQSETTREGGRVTALAAQVTEDGGVASTEDGSTVSCATSRHRQSGEGPTLTTLTTHAPAPDANADGDNAGRHKRRRQ